MSLAADPKNTGQQAIHKRKQKSDVWESFLIQTLLPIFAQTKSSHRLNIASTGRYLHICPDSPGDNNPEWQLITRELEALKIPVSDYRHAGRLVIDLDLLADVPPRETLGEELILNSRD